MTVGQKRTVLVTGGGGFLGGAIVRLLVSNGEKVRNFSRSTYMELEALGVEQIQGDLTDADAVRRACHAVETVYHVAAKAGFWGRYEDYYGVNVTGTLNVINACQTQGVSRLIYTSSPSVVFDGKDMTDVDESVPYPATYEAHYPKTKAIAERAVLKAAEQGLAAIALRPHIIWGPGDNHLIPRLLERAHRLRQIGDGKNLVDTIYVDNAAKAHLFADERLRKHPELSGRVYFLSQDDPVPLWKMVNAFLAAGGKPPIKKSIPASAGIFLGGVCEVIYKLFKVKGDPPMTRFVARELATSHWFNIQAAKTDLGYFPETSISQGLDRLAKWLKVNPIHSGKRS